MRVPRPLHLPILGTAALACLGAAVVAAVDLPAETTAAAPVPRVSTPARVPALEASRTRPSTVVPAAVAPLRKLISADLILTTKAPLTQKEIGQLSGISGVTATSVISTGAVRVGTRAINAMGVDPSSFRSFTPKPTAASDALWASVARDELAGSFAAKLPLGSTVHLFGAHAGDHRIGAVAAYDLPGAGIVVDRHVAREVGLVTNTVILAAPDRKISRLEDNIRDVVGDKVTFTQLRPVQVAVNRRPATYRELYMLSATYCPGLSWKVLAAIGQVESDHGRDVGPSSAGALGPMQFLPSTWAEYGVDGDGDGKADIMSPYDAVPAASLYLCRNGAGQGGQSLYDAIFNYNHADWYVKKVLALAAAYQ